MRRVFIPLLVAILGLVGGAAPAAWASASLSTPVGSPPGRGLAAVPLGTLGGAESIPAAVNDRGQVVGRSQTASGDWHAFLADRGTIIDLAPGFASSAAFDLNNAGAVLLQRWAVVGGPMESVLWKPSGEVSLGQVDARFVNERGQVAGTVLNLADPANPSANPFRWERGVRTDMAPIAGWEGASSRIVDFNDSGLVLGIGLGPESFETGFVWSGGPTVTPVRDPRLFGGNGVVDLDNTGRVVGNSYLDGAFVWRGGVTTLLGTLSGRGDVSPVAINDRGAVVGYTAAIDGGPDQAFVWVRGQYTPLGVAGLASRAVDINGCGQVVGDYDRRDSAGTVRSTSFLWRGGALLDLGAGLTGTPHVVAISERGFVIGTVTGASGAAVAVLWKPRR